MPTPDPSTAPAEKLGPAVTLYGAANPTANVRSGPGTDHGVVGSLKYREQVSGQLVSGTTWYKIGAEKYVAQSVVSTTKPAANPPNSNNGGSQGNSGGSGGSTAPKKQNNGGGITQAEIDAANARAKEKAEEAARKAGVQKDANGCDVYPDGRIICMAGS